MTTYISPTRILRQRGRIPRELRVLAEFNDKLAPKDDTTDGDSNAWP